MTNQIQKSQGELINQLSKSRTSKKEWINGELVEIKKPAPVTVKTTAQPDLSHLPPVERLTAARKLAQKHELSTGNEPALTNQTAEEKFSKFLDEKMRDKTSIQEVVFPNGKKVYAFR